MKILIADDHPTSRKLLRLTLVAEGYDVVEAEDGEQALERLKEGTPFDALISDILMPRMDGYRLCFELRRVPALRSLPVIIYSSTYASPSEESVARNMGADRFLRKPAPSAAILQMLEEVLRTPRAPAEAPTTPAAEFQVLRHYSERLVQKLEEKNLALEGAQDRLSLANEKLRRSEEQVRLLLDATAEGIYGLDPEGRFTFCNAACLRLLGVADPAALLGRFAHALVHHGPDGTLPNEVECGICRNLREGQPQQSEGVLHCSDGTDLFVENHSYPLLKNGTLVGGVVTFLDMTQRRAAERDVRKSEARFRRLFESNTIGIAIARLDGVTAEANDAYLTMLGYSRDELASGAVRWDRLTPPEFRERDELATAELLRTGVAAPFEKEILDRNGKRIPVLIGIAMLERSEESVIAYIVDLSRPRQLEHQLRQAQKMEAVGQLAGGIAHDFNNLLTSILGYAEIVARRVSTDAVAREEVAEIRRAGERAAGLTRQLLAFSRRQVLDPRVLDLNSVVRDVERMLGRLIGEDIDLVTALDPNLASVRADEGQLGQVILNLAVNSRDAMPRGGRLTLETLNVELDRHYMRLHAGVVPGRYVMLAVTDTGSGMDAETQSHIFEPFFTTKDKDKGTGLGLSTVHGIVNQSGGHIWVYSEPGRGTTFKVYLPAVAGAAEVARPAPVDLSATPASETILLVEDEAAVRRLARTMLEGLGYTVLEAARAEDAFTAARDHPDPIHLMLTDVVMPGISGDGLAERVVQLRPSIRVLYMSGYTDDAIVRNGILQPGNRFLQKPFTMESLARKVREALF